MTQEEMINEAIINYLTVFYPIDSLVDVEQKYGNEIVRIIERITKYATNNTIWSNDDELASYKTTINKLAIEYPFLTQPSMLKIADLAAYFWK